MMAPIQGASRRAVPSVDALALSKSRLNRERSQLHLPQEQQVARRRSNGLEPKLAQNSFLGLNHKSRTMRFNPARLSLLR